MKRFWILTLSACFCTILWASPRSIEQAQELATEHVRSQAAYAKAPAVKAKLTHCHTAPQKNGQPAFYVFNRGEDGGFVIVSAETRTHTVLGYSTNGHFDAATIPDNMRAWLEGYTEAIQYAASLPERPAQQRPQHAPKAYTPIAPICKTQWGQNTPYNLQCPDDNGVRCVTGCVATAAAQIMKHHNYPTKGKGSNSYYWFRSPKDSVLLSANFGNTTYNWSQMLNYYTGSATNAQKNAVAKLMSDCGIACYMDYGTGGSGAYTPNMMQALVENFRYNAAIRAVPKDYMKEADFLKAVIADLQAGRPVWFNGRTKSDEGHAFVCDGLDADGLVHINWGWDGHCDNYFHVSALDPEDQGTGGSASDEAYTEQVTAYTNIIPSEGGQYRSTITADVIRVEDTRVGRNEGIRFTAEILQNMGISYWEGSMGLQVYKNSNLYKTYSFDYTFYMYPGTYYFDGWISQVFDDLPVGEYELVPVARATNSGVDPTPSPILVKYSGEFRCPLTVTNDSVFLTLPEPEIPVHDPSDYIYSDFNGYYHPEYSGGDHRWDLQLETPNFFNEGASNQAILLFGINSSSANSFIGSYLSDETAHFPCYYATMFVGNIDSYKRFNADEAEMTLTYDATNNYYWIQYRMRFSNRTYTGNAGIPAEQVWGYYGVEYGTHAQNENIPLDNTHYNALTTTQASNMITSHPVGWTSSIPYVVSGTISSIESTPSQMRLNKNCRLYITDGTTPLYVYNSRWLDNTGFSTGREIQVGGKATIVGSLNYFSTSVKEMQSGYFCLYEDGGLGIEYVPEKSDEIVQKVLRNGQLFIIRNGVTYTADGIKVND